ncbi:hypothetical protein Ancab_029501 [Ancistrocladus abbreviatus]
MYGYLLPVEPSILSREVLSLIGVIHHSLTVILQVKAIKAYMFSPSSSFLSALALQLQGQYLDTFFLKGKPALPLLFITTPKLLWVLDQHFLKLFASTSDTVIQLAVFHWARFHPGFVSGSEVSSLRTRVKVVTLWVSSMVMPISRDLKQAFVQWSWLQPPILFRSVLTLKISNQSLLAAGQKKNTWTISS